MVEGLKREGKKVVFTNGCFDILHAGHVDYLEKAKALGDVLIVGMNSDASVRKIKGQNRPVVPQDLRARVLTALTAVDYVFVFDDETPYNLIKLIKPHILVKGADWKLEDIVGREFAGKVVRIPFTYDISTTAIIRKVLARFCR